MRGTVHRYRTLLTVPMIIAHIYSLLTISAVQPLQFVLCLFLIHEFHSWFIHKALGYHQSFTKTKRLHSFFAALSL